MNLRYHLSTHRTLLTEVERLLGENRKLRMERDGWRDYAEGWVGLCRDSQSANERLTRERDSWHRAWKAMCDAYRHLEGKVPSSAKGAK